MAAGAIGFLCLRGTSAAYIRPGTAAGLAPGQRNNLGGFSGVVGNRS